jgi:tRNA modification GTPase
MVRIRMRSAPMTPPASTDTIAAIATAPGEAGIAIVRVSGPESLRIADALFRSSRRPSDAAARTILYGRLASDARPNAEVADEVLLLVFRAPHSYTREDIVEIQGHGGRVAAARILRAVLAAGARLAEPGEFTRRAFINGRLDLPQAEAVADLIRAQSDRAATLATEQLGGALSALYTNTYNHILGVCLDLEACIDFTDDDIPASVPGDLQQRLQAAWMELDRLLASSHQGHLLREGALVVIAGEPNAGKSTLMNALLGRDRAIVSEHPGTTRDTIEEQLVVHGIPIRLVDTAGLRTADCPIEREGVRRAEDLMCQADLVVLMIDGTRPLDEQNRMRLCAVDPNRSIVILNKCDLGCVTRSADLQPEFTVLETCALRREDVETIRGAIVGKLGIGGADISHVAISERHRVLTMSASHSLGEAIRLLRDAGVDGSLLAAHELRNALTELGSITGLEYSTKLLDGIFSRFCIGK